MRMIDEKDRAIYALSEFAAWLQVLSLANSDSLHDSIGKNDHDTIVQKFKESGKKVLECKIASVALLEVQRELISRLSEQTISAINTAFGEHSTE